MIVISDTTPLNYLILIQAINVLPELYGQVIIPQTVRKELGHPKAPESVRAWIGTPQSWLVIQNPLQIPGPELAHLDAGERDAILLAEDLRADQIIIDEIRGRNEAYRRNQPYTGTLGVLSVAAERRLLDLGETVERLRRTSFHVSEDILSRLLKNSKP